MGIHVYNKEKGFIPKSCGFQLICWCITFAIALIVCVTNIDLGMILGRIVQLVILGPIVLFILFAIIGFIIANSIIVTTKESTIKTRNIGSIGHIIPQKCIENQTMKIEKKCLEEKSMLVDTFLLMVNFMSLNI